MFTTKPESGEKITKLSVGAGDAKTPFTESKLGGGAGDAKSPFTERPATYASKSLGPSASKMVPSIIGEDLTIRGNITSKGELQVDGEIEGDIHCGSLLLGDTSKVTGGVAAEDVVVRGHIVGSVRGLRITLQGQSVVEGDIFYQSLAIEQGASFEGTSHRSENPLAEIKTPGANSSAKGFHSASSPSVTSPAAAE
jgi:cytoskeletal protein CcmA (bactofilin family)